MAAGSTLYIQQVSSSNYLISLSPAGYYYLESPWRFYSRSWHISSKYEEERNFQRSERLRFISRKQTA